MIHYIVLTLKGRLIVHGCTIAEKIKIPNAIPRPCPCQSEPRLEAPSGSDAVHLPVAHDRSKALKTAWQDTHSVHN